MQVSFESSQDTNPARVLKKYLDPILLFTLPLVMGLFLGFIIQQLAPSDIPAALIGGIAGVFIGNANLACWKHAQSDPHTRSEHN